MAVVHAVDVGAASMPTAPADVESASPPSERTLLRSATVRALLAIERAMSGFRVIIALAVAAALWWGQSVLIPIVLSITISYALEPVITRLDSWRVHRRFAVPLVLALLVAAIGGGAYALRGEVVAFANRLPDAAHTVATAIQRATHGTPDPVAKVQEAAHELETAAKSAGNKDDLDGVTAVRIEEPTFRWSDWMWRGGYGMIGFAGQMFAVFCLVYYLLASGDLYKRKLVHMVPTLTEKKITVQILAEIDRQIERFLFARMVISGVVGVAIWIAFRAFGLHEAGVWGVLSAILFAVPLAGPAVITVGAAIAGFVQFDSLSMAVAVGSVCLVIAALEGNALTPWLMSRVGEMNAVAVFVSLLFWGWLWGLWGLLLAVPITAAFKAVSERVDGLQACAEWLKD